MDKRVAAVIIKDNKILLMRRFKNGKKYFVFPGGGVEENESIEDALIREIKEEFDIDISIERLLFQNENQGRQEIYFLVKEFIGIPQLSGEEKERMNKDNQYFPVWLDLKEVFELPNLYPKEAKKEIEKLIKK